MYKLILKLPLTENVQYLYSFKKTLLLYFYTSFPNEDMANLSLLFDFVRFNSLLGTKSSPYTFK